jgi:hypothetical protein
MKLLPSSFKNLKLGKKTISILISFLISISVITIYNLEDRDLFKALRIFKAIEQKSLDVRFQIRGTRDPGNEIVIVAIDENSIKKLGRYPWPRKYIAQFIESRSVVRTSWISTSKSEGVRAAIAGSVMRTNPAFPLFEIFPQ